MRVPVAILCVVLAACLSLTHAKLVSVTGQGVIRSTPPPNVLDASPTDQSSDFKDGQLAITAFDEKLGHVLSSDILISQNPDVYLRANVPYDSFFIFFHIKRGSSLTQASANAVFNVDNRVIGCTVGNTVEFTTSFEFGVPQTTYPMSSAELSDPPRRGYESNDWVNGAGTAYISNNNIQQPGDYTRCFTASCSDPDGNACQCSASMNQCIQSSDDYKCFNNASELVALDGFQFSSTCRVSSASIVAEFGSCLASNGCKRHNGQVCLSGRGSSVELDITAGCGCAQTITAAFTPSPGAPAGCLVPDTSIGCKTSSKVLIYGAVDETFPPWLQANIPGIDLTHDQNVTFLTSAYLAPYDLVIIAQLYARILTAEESDTLVEYLNNGGAAITLAGFTNSNTDRSAQEAPFQSLGIAYADTLIALGPALNYNANNPLTAGLAPGYVDFVGGWASSPYTGPGTSEFFASGESAGTIWNIGQTITLPSGGRIVAWGDEWVTYTARYSEPNNVDAQFWKNAIAWSSDICVPDNPSPCAAETVRVSSSCTQVSHASNGKGFTLSFSDSVTNCN